MTCPPPVAYNSVIQRRYATLLWKVWAVSTQTVNAMRHRSSGRYSVSIKFTIGGDGRPPARATAVAARRLAAVRPADEAAQLAYSEWLLAKLTA